MRTARCPSKDGALAAKIATVAIERRQASQRRGLTAIEFSQFGHLGQEQRRRAWADPGYGGELLCFGRELFRLLDQFFKEQISPRMSRLANTQLRRLVQLLDNG